MNRNLIPGALALVGSALVLTGQAPPAPTEDRVGFPADYQQTFTKLLTFDRPDNGQIRAIWANPVAARVLPWEQYPYGSVLLFESWTSQRDANNGILLDENGRFLPNQLTTIFVKRKEPGFGAAYAQNRNGEWEYVAYRPDGSVQTAPQSTAGCAICHLQAGPAKDFTFRRDRFFRGGTGAAPLATISHYSFIPGDLTVKRGAVVTWYNDDEVDHQIYSPQGGFNSDGMFQGASYSFKFTQPGEYEIRCSIHAGMRAKVKVE